MTISLTTLIFESLVNFPRSISVPNSPMSIPDLEMLLKALPKAPFNRFIFHYYFPIFLLDNEIRNRKKILGVSSSSKADKIIA